MLRNLISLGLSFPYLFTTHHSLLATALLQLLIERGVAVAEQRDQGPDAEGGAEREFEEDQECGHHRKGFDPVSALHQTPCSHELQPPAGAEPRSPGLVALFGVFD